MGKRRKLPEFPEPPKCPWGPSCRCFRAHLWLDAKLDEWISNPENDPDTLRRIMPGIHAMLHCIASNTSDLECRYNAVMNLLSPIWDNLREDRR
jgi:hypothetical protein